MNDYERNADVSKTLTDKWRKGELPEGWYYVKGNRAEGIYAYTAEYLNNMYRPRNGEKIIEQVPSYEQWQAKLEENAKLKSLLKECREHLKYVVICPQNKKIVEKLDQVLGEE